MKSQTSGENMDCKLPNLAPIAALLVFLTSGCGDKAKNVADNVAETQAEAKIIDQWVSQCKNVPLDALNLASRTERFDFGTDSISLESTFYSNDNCVSPVLLIKEAGVYKVGDRIAPGTYNLDKTYQTVNLTPLNDEGKNLLNAVAACGINDWQVSVTREITAATSDNPLDRCWSKTPRSVYDIANITLDELHFGKAAGDLDKTAPEKRPTEVDLETKFTRQ